MSPLVTPKGSEPKETFGDKGREGTPKIEIWGDVFYGWSHRDRTS